MKLEKVAVLSLTNKIISLLPLCNYLLTYLYIIFAYLLYTVIKCIKKKTSNKKMGVLIVQNSWFYAMILIEYIPIAYIPIEYIASGTVGNFA